MTRKSLIRKFHTLCSAAGIGEMGKRAMLESYGVESSRELSDKELMELCAAIERTTSRQYADLDRWRKRLIASIYGWMQMQNKYADINIVKGVACRAAQKSRFNDIPMERLRSLYYAFKQKTDDIAMVGALQSRQNDLIN